MARNPVQFQRGMSVATFLQRYGSEEQCHDALIAMRWPSGFECPSCGGRAHSYCKPRRLFQCSACGHQASVKAGTIFHRAKVPLTKWFLAIYLLAQSKNDISAMELMRQLGVKYDTAWLMKHKIMAAMLEANVAQKLDGDVPVDDSILAACDRAKVDVGARTRSLSSPRSRRGEIAPGALSCAGSSPSRRPRSRNGPWSASGEAQTS
jgi:transposase-like protein